MACEDSALDTLKNTNTNPSVSSSVNAGITGGKEPVKDKHWWIHTTVLIIALVLVYHYAKKLWNKSPIMKAGIVVVGAIFLHDTMHHLWNKGFVYSVKAKLNV